MPEDFKNAVSNAFFFLMVQPGTKWLLWES